MSKYKAIQIYTSKQEIYSSDIISDLITFSLLKNLRDLKKIHGKVEKIIVKFTKICPPTFQSLAELGFSRSKKALV